MDGTNHYSRRSFIKRAGSVLRASSTLGGILPHTATSISSPLKTREIAIGTFGPPHCATPFVYAK